MKSTKDLSFIYEGREFIYISPITKSKTFGIIKEIVLTPVIFETGHFSVNISFISTNGVSYNFDKDIKIITDFNPEKANKALEFIDSMKQVRKRHAAILDEYVRKKFNIETNMFTADVDDDLHSITGQMGNT